MIHYQKLVKCTFGLLLPLLLFTGAEAQRVAVRKTGRITPKALMMVVGDNTARAFAIFAAAALVRFRTNIKDPKEITALLISLALGSAADI